MFVRIGIISILVGCGLAGIGVPVHAEPQDLARRIDRRLEERFQAEGIVPAERADDAEFLRRLSLDLMGRTPTPDEVREFLNDRRADKRSLWIDRAQRDPRQARHFAHVWRSLLLPEAETEPQLRYFQPGFEAWLARFAVPGARFDSLVKELLAAPIPGPDEPPQFVLRDLQKPNPLAFIAANGADPAKLASNSVRLFLGLRLECAQCHDHPFDHWTQRQFWNQAAFFAGIERRGKGPFAPLVENRDKTSIPLMDTGQIVPTAFLDRPDETRGDPMSARVRFAEWVVSPENPYFAPAIVNRVWALLMGSGLVDPVDDFRDENTSRFPGLLAELAEEFKTSGYDVSSLVRAICLSEAYQRTSRQTHESQADPAWFSRMALKPMSGEQFFDTLMQTVECAEPEDSPKEDGDEKPLRRGVLRIFSQARDSGEPETSVAQALALMNGNLIAKAVTLETSGRLQRTLAAHPDAPERQIEELYLAALGRFPSPEERQRMLDYCAKPSDRDAGPGRRLEDVFWVLLNSAEFRWNH